MHRRASLSVVTLLAALLALGVHAWPPPSRGGYRDVSGDVGLGTDVSFRVAALADWNSDKYVDLIGVSHDNKTLEIRLWDSGAHAFDLSHSFTMNGSIVSAVVADFNRDGWVDIFVHRGAAIAPCMILGAWTSDGAQPVVDCESFSFLHDLPNSPVATALVIHGNCANVDLQMTLSNGSLVTLYNSQSGRGSSDCNFIGGIPTWRVETMHDNAYVPGTGSGVDLDGNCVAEIVIGRFKNHVIEYSATEGHVIKASWTVPEYVGAASWMDASGDGVIDVVYPSCVAPFFDKITDRWSCGDRFDALLFVLASTGGARACSGDNCCGGHPISFPSVLNASEPGPGYVNWPLMGAGRKGCGTDAAEFHLRSDERFPAFIRSMDLNRDRMVDIVVRTNLGPAVLERRGGGNTPDFSCFLLDSGASSRNAEFRDGIPFFFDLSEDRRVDIMVTSTSGVGVWAYWNGGDMGDRYFLSAVTLNGVKGPASSFPSWGAVQIGATHRFMWQDINTNMHYASSTQYSNSQNHALQMPYENFGLARTFSYVQNYATGMKIAGHTQYNSWPVYLIPNSQVVCFAYPLTDARRWEIRLFLPASRFKKLLLYSLITALAVLGVPIVYLRLREVKADKRELQASIQ